VKRSICFLGRGKQEFLDGLDSAICMSHRQTHQWGSMLAKQKFPSEAGKSQDASPLNALARRYYGPLISFFGKRTHNDADTQDLVQQVFLRLAQSRKDGEIHNPDAYIFQTAANTLRDHHRYHALTEAMTREVAP
jgi:hypothetical protein